MTYYVEFSAYTTFDDLDHEPTKEEITDLLYCLIDDLAKGYIEPDVNIYTDDDLD